MRVRGVEGVVAFHAGNGGEGAAQYTPKGGVGAARAPKPQSAAGRGGPIAEAVGVN